MTDSRSPSESWLSDDPVTGGTDAPDRLGRGDFARVAVSVLHRFRLQSDSSVIALIGGWGSGKSSLLNLIKRELAQRDEQFEDASWIVVDFNPWLYPDLPTLQAGFFRELEASLPKDQKKLRRARRRLSKFGRSIAPLGVVGTLFGLDLSRVIETVAGWFGGDQSVTGMQKSATQALEAANRPILMVLDDLDRLDPDELLLVFKLIRLTGRLHNVYYLVSYDEDSLLDALSRTGLVGKAEPRRALDYLEKIIQVRLDVPPLREQQASEWVDESFEDLAQRHVLNLENEAKERFNKAYQQTLRDRLDTPRSIKRYFAQADAFLESVRDELDVVDFLLLTWLRTAEPLVYSLLSTERDRLVGSRTAWPSFSKPDPAELKKYWMDRLGKTRLNATRTESVAQLIGQLFPRFQREWAADRISGDYPNAKMKRVAHPDYFDRFFSFAVPQEDLSDSVVEGAFAQIITGNHGKELDLVESAFPESTSLVVNKLRHNYEKDKRGILPLLIWLAEQHHLIPDVNGLATPRQQARWLSQQIYVEAPADVPVAAVAAVANVPEGLTLASYWVDAANHEQNTREASEQQKAAFVEAKERFAELVHESFETHSEVSPLRLDSEVWNLIWDWYRIDPETVREFVRKQVQEGRWVLLDLIARLATSSTIVGVENPLRTLSGLDFEMIDGLVGLDFVLAELRALIDGADEPPVMDHTTEATDDNRREYVLAMLRAERDRRGRAIEGAGSELAK